MTGPRSQFEILQAYRGLAAGAVVFDHLHFQSAQHQGAGLLPEFFRFGHLGVDFFFVLSGFIIQHVHGADAGRPERAGEYLWRRIARVWPLLALLTTLKLVYMLVLGAGVREEKFELGVVVASYLSLPQPGWPVLDVAWTLQHEALFYALFLVPILLGRGAWRVVLGAWLALIALVLVRGAPPSFPVSFLASPLNAEFLLGVAACLWLQRRPPGPRAALALLVAGLAASALGFWLYSGARTSEEKSVRLVLALGLMLVLVASVTLERTGRVRAPRWLHALGDASYSLYLWHGFVIGGALVAWSRLPAALQAWPRAYLAVVALAAFVSSLWLHRWIERPLMERFRRLRPRAPQH